MTALPSRLLIHARPNYVGSARFDVPFVFPCGLDANAPAHVGDGDEVTCPACLAVDAAQRAARDATMAEFHARSPERAESHATAYSFCPECLVRLSMWPHHNDCAQPGPHRCRGCSVYEVDETGGVCRACREERT